METSRGAALDDRLLVQKILAKDAEAERYFFHNYRDRLYKAGAYLLGAGDREVEDVIQETFIAAFQQLPQFEFRSSLSTWLVRICMNRCYERIRQRQRQIVRFEEELEEISGAHSVEKERQKEEDAEKHEMMSVIENQKEIMGDPCRGLLKMRDEEERSYADISKALKIPMGTVMSRLARCKETLKKLVLQALGEKSHA
jgi:RNA polymerase sigma-70 factor (ECF subfamily)